MGEFVDQKTMFNAGYASTYKPSLKPQRNDMIDKAFSWIGEQALGHYQTAFKELGELKQKANSAASVLELEIEKVGDELNPQIQGALDIFKKEYDKGARCVKLSWSAKKRAGCQEAMDKSMLKMTKMNEHLEILQVRRKLEQDRAKLMNGDTGHDHGDVKMYNSGSHGDELAYSTMLANGTLLNHMEVNMETGELQLAEEVGTGEYKVIPGQYTERTGELPAAGGDSSAYSIGGQEIPTIPGQEESAISGQEMQGQEGGMVTKDPGQYEQDREEIMEVGYTKLQDIRFAPAEDDSLQDIQQQIMTASYDGGMSGKNGERDDIMNSLTLDKIRGHVNDAGNDAIKSYFFGGTLVTGTNTKLPESAPVYQYLIGASFEPGTTEWNGALEALKYENFGKGSELRETVSQFMYEKANQFYDNGYNKYLSQKEVTDKKSVRGQEEKDVPNVDGIYAGTTRSDARKKANNMLREGVEFGGQWKYVQDGKGNSTRYRQVEDKDGNIIWKNEGTTSVNEMIKFRGLGELGIFMEEPEATTEEETKTDAEGFEDYNPASDIPEEYRATLDDKIVDVRKLSSLEGLNMTDKMKWLTYSQE